MALTPAKLAEIKDMAEVLGTRTIRLLVDEVESQRREMAALRAEVSRLTNAERVAT